MVDASADRGERRERRRPQRHLGTQTQSLRCSLWIVAPEPFFFLIYLFIYIFLSRLKSVWMAWSPPDTAFPLRFPLVVFFFCAAACDAKAKGCDWKSVKTNHQAAAVTFLRFLLRYVSCVDVATAFRVAPLMSLLILFFFFCLLFCCFLDMCLVFSIHPRQFHQVTLR